MRAEYVWLGLILLQAAMLAAGVRYWRRLGRPTLGSKQLLRLLRMARLSREAICLIDTAHRITEINHVHTELTGYRQAEMRGRTLVEWLRTSLDGAEPLARIEAALRKGTELRTEIRFRCKQGDTRVMILQLHPLHDKESGFQGFVVVLIDIDQQRRERDLMSQALRDKQTLLDILDHHAIVTETDRHGVITRVNEQFVQVSGYSPEELIGNTHRMISSGQHSPAFWKEVWSTISQGNIWRGTICNRAKDGHLYWVDSVIAPLLGPDNRIEKYVSIRTDITEMKSNQDLLIRTSNIAGIGGWDALVESQAVHFSEEARRILGLAARALDLRDAGAPVPAEIREALLESIRHGAQAGQTSSRTLRLDLPDGRTRWVNMVSETEMLRGQPYRLAGSVQDITEQVQTQQRIQTSGRILRLAIDTMDEAFALFDAQDRLAFCNEKYRDLFGERRDLIVPGITIDAIMLMVSQGETLFLVHTNEKDLKAWWTAQFADPDRPQSRQRAQLRNGRWVNLVNHATDDGMRVMFCIDITDIQNALRAANAATESKSRFLANMSHEIRTPMNAIIGILQLLEPTPLDPGQQDLLRKISSAAHMQLSILNDILDFSKIEAGQMQLDIEPFYLDDMMGDLEVILSGYLGKKPLALVYDVDPGIPGVLRGDMLRLKQVLMNLGSNAIKFTHSGQVALRLRLVRLDDRGALVEFSVQDTGIGISDRQRKKIFQSFTQAEASISRRYGGTGLGLAISRRLVYMMNAGSPDGQMLDVDSEPGRGSRFSFRLLLPVAAPGAKARPGAAPQQSGPRLRGLRLLLAEDNPINQEVALLLLQREGATVAVAEDGQQALDTLRAAREAYDLVLMDMQMPVLDGLQASRAIRQMPQFARLPIIAMTANAMLPDRLACLEAGMNDHVGKPFDINHLVGVILQYTRDIPAPARQAAPAVEAPHDAPPELDAQAALERFGQDPAFYAGLLRKCAVSMPALGERVLRAAPGQARDAAHQLKSSAATVGALRLSALCARIEQALRDDAPGGPGTGADAGWRQEFEQALAAALHAQAQWLAAHDEPEAAPPTGDEDLAGLLEVLADKLAMNDMSVFALFDELAKHGQATLSGPAWDALQQAMDTFDTEAAIAAIRALQAGLPTAKHQPA